MENFQVKCGSKKDLQKLMTGEFGLVTDENGEELYIGVNSQNRKIALLSDDGKLPEAQLPVHTHGINDIGDSTITTAKLVDSEVIPGTYKSVTVNEKGIVTAGSNPTTLAGFGITDAYTKEKSKSIFGLIESVTFDENYIPLTIDPGTSLSTGSFATENTSIKYVYISSKVTSVSSGTFVGCTNLTDIYVDNTEGSISFPTNNLPRGAKVHYVDNFNANSYIIKALLALRDKVETGNGTLTNVSTSGADVRYAYYSYQRVGNFVTLNISIQLDASTGGLIFSGLPYNTQIFSSDICVSSDNILCKWSIDEDPESGNAILQINKSDRYGVWAHNSGEGLKFIAIYEV